jgi:hypothetical protein
VTASFAVQNHHLGGALPMFDAHERPAALALIEAIATALRTELAGEIEEQPGFRDPLEAGQVNRAFRITARTILRTITAHADDLSALLNSVLLRLAWRRLAAELLDTREIEHLLGLEPAARDDWLIFLILTTRSEIEHLLQTRGPDEGPHASTPTPP